MKISILTTPRYAAHRVLRQLKGHDIAIWNDHVQDVDRLFERLRDTEVLVLIRERTQIRAPLINRLERLKLISQRSVFPHIDIDACTRRGVIVSSSQHADTPSYAAAELTWGLVLAAMPDSSRWRCCAQEWQIGVQPARRHLGVYAGGSGRGRCEGVRDDDGSRGAARACPGGRLRSRARRRFS
jgi:D-3-phosphoglycerate dehydrogenase